ncbi:MAG: hypothetical protein DMG18_13985 [Acidobacteria bacterium]|nr:MAG: hypothetical protein DMG18_13985 [Acidobacteriota bacterium]
MRIGFALPQIGPIGGPDAITRVARRAEELGFDSLWVLDRLLYPVNPRAPYPVGDGTLPIKYKRVLDAIETLTFAAARTERIALGTSVLNIPWYNPVLLARRLATLDVLSGGRLRVGLGIGWSPDEYEAAGASWKTRGKGADERVSALKAIWTRVRRHRLQGSEVLHRFETNSEAPSANLHGRIHTRGDETGRT